ncbi:hypothetical protein QCN29_11305 [Streptomyces sp. HNM0663]|uniref:Transposase n=1 Tax=Streptomyces chengmaiensis TaxID=3040919 RepID=A0ABT6HKV5_9ACTN|nr:hypothetical protein [Streptomyces chengmaiensis]MDH2389369.1 hypothetical protein [Streptomyces chengmaiensis]
MAAARTLAAAVFVTDPKTHQTLLLQPGAEVSDPAIAEQITHPDAWVPEPPRPLRRTKTETS